MKIFLWIVLISYILCVLGAIVNMVYAYIPELKDWRKENTDIRWRDLFFFCNCNCPNDMGFMPNL